MSPALRFTFKKSLKILMWTAVLYALFLPVLFWLYKSNRGLPWWDILGGDPRVPPEYRTYLMKNGSEFAPNFDLWAVTRALPFQVVSMLFTVIMLMTFMIVQFAGLFWFLSRGRTYIIYPREYDVGFEDVRGQPEIVGSTKEALTLFQGFKKFRDAGGYPPHGILFEGPPGTGKTLLGQAIAGSAKVPFVYASGTSFNNMFMGIGNLRVARLFRKARRLSDKYGGSVIFLDELDAVGGSRGGISTAMADGPPAHGPLRFIMAPGGGMGGGMLVNELLIQMDGMTMPKGLWRHVRRLLHLPGKPKIPQYNVMVIGATNQASTLDPALLRPGRFDRKLHVGNPSSSGREDILQYYLDKVRHDPVDISRLARATYGFSPAQIKNLVNEALIFALVDGRETLNFNDLWQAKVTEEIGLKEPSSTSARDRQMTAFHEAGHAVLGYILELDDQIQVASIIKRRDTLGVVYRTPIEERHTELREDMRRDIVVSLGGLAAELIWFGDTTGGPVSDLRQATYRAAMMLGMLGMGENLISYGVLNENPYGGGGPMAAILQDGQNREAIAKLLMECKQEAVDLLRRNEPAVRALAERLLEKDEVQGEEIEDLMRAKAVARATPAFRPLLELVGETWHAPMLVEANPSDAHDKRDRDQAEPPPGPPGPGSAWRSSAPSQPTVDRSEGPREFEW